MQDLKVEVIITIMVMVTIIITTMVMAEEERSKDKIAHHKVRSNRRKIRMIGMIQTEVTDTGMNQKMEIKEMEVKEEEMEAAMTIMV